eukprot:Clim_evm8s231 gene=Clim_evmTU8s231
MDSSVETTAEIGLVTFVAVASTLISYVIHTFVSMLVAVAVIVTFTYTFIRYPTDDWGRIAFDEGFSPHRVYLLLKALLGQLKNLTYALPFAKSLFYYYRYAGPDVVTKRVPYSKNGVDLDVWHFNDSVSTTKAMETEEGRRNRGRPIVIYAYGGGWNSGTGILYGALAKQLNNAFGCAVITMDYILWPRGTMPDMLQDVRDCVNWVVTNAASFQGDIRRIHFVGHSAGAQVLLAALLLDKQISGQVKSYVGLGGPYDVERQFRHETELGVELLSALRHAMEGRKNLHKWNPTRLIADVPQSVINELPPMTIIHDREDDTVPFDEVTNFCDACKKRKVFPCVVPIENFGHCRGFVHRWSQQQRRVLASSS